ncbi:hypothetical protein [Frondihabitans australicus]|uniref:Uncharacterized protein n=1 Tax=Frondihabitans australicus TaxID=386892 RepID=A0A495IFR6_9MICO|nr:hypothetical protein [Frondihabitans australicus]RKR74045.1 hypothetical protein C8E83_1147 [Frondihabitans australicus]
MSASGGTTGDAPAVGDPATVSALAARILGQLSLSAWLPGAFFVACIAVLLWFQRVHSVTLAGAGQFVQHNWIPFLIFALPAVVISTLVTQAFAFEAIRALEGYWPSVWPLDRFRHSAQKRALKRKAARSDEYESALVEAFRSARPALEKRGIHEDILDAVERDLQGKARPSRLTEDEHDEADSLEWEELCAPWHSARIVRLRQARSELPEDSRVMPTRLGNVLRAGEDALTNSGDLEGFVMRNRDRVPSRILVNHDEFRTRLDMYCTMVFVSLALGAFTWPILWNVPWPQRVVVSAILAVTAAASYLAALGSARGYVVVLRQIDRYAGTD